MGVFIMSNKKQYFITSITLGAIAAVAAGLIGLANLVTKDRIAQNEINKLNAGLAEIYGENATFGDETIIEGDYQYLTCYYEASINDNVVGYIYRASGSNNYGKVTLLAGIDIITNNVRGINLLVNEQTYATTLQENYIDVINSTKNFDDVDVSCGATYGAKLVKAMINEARDYQSEHFNEGGN